MRRHDTARRTRGIFAVSAASILFSGLFVGPATAEPEVNAEDVEAALNRVSAINEKVQAATVEIDDSQKELDSLSKDIGKQQAEYDKQREILGRSVVQQQVDAPLGATVSLIGSENPREFIDGLGAKLAFDTTQAQRLQDFQQTARSLKNRKVTLKERKAELAAQQAKLKRTQAKLKADHKQVQAQLAELNAADRADATGASRADTKTPDLNIKATGRAGKAVAFARAQLGDRYVYGGTGPDAWDCSGLTQGAWAAAGVSIPRVAGPQYQAGQKISMSELKPGDLVFYGDFSHAAIYIGGGKVIEAANSSRPVQVAPVSYGFSKAARVG